MDSKSINDDSIPGFDRPLIWKDFELGSNVYNEHLPEDKTLIEATKLIEKHLPEIRPMFEYFGVNHVLAVNALHRHGMIRDGSYVVGQIAIRNELPIYLTRAVDDALDPGEACGTKYKYDLVRGFIPYEFYKGPLPGTINEVDPEFFLQFTDYLATHNLSSVLGLVYIPKKILLMYNWIEHVFTDGATVQTPILATDDIATKVPTVWYFPEPNITRKLHCVPDRDAKHPSPNKLVMQQYQINDNFSAILTADL